MNVFLKLNKMKNWSNLVVLSNKMKFLVRLLKEEDNVRKNYDCDELHFTTRVVQIRNAFEPVERNETVKSV